jgi:hypothetical protein
MHVMCVAHALHKACETTLGLSSNVDKLVASGKKIFVKSPARIELFKNKALDTQFLSSPVITHWGTWLGTFVYYREIFCGKWTL